jgi:hypothetical protein
LSEQQSQAIFDLPKIIAVGIASPSATVLTSRFGVAGTLVGLALSAVFITAAVDFLKVYLARVPGAVTTIPGGFRKKSALGKVFERMRRPFSKFASLPRPRRRSLLIGSVAAAGISFLVGLIIVTGLELGVGKSLSCWVWEECSMEESSADGGGSSATTAASTLPSILGGAQSSSSISQETPSIPSNLQQEQPGSSPGAQQGPLQAPPADSSAQPGQRQGPSGIQAPSQTPSADSSEEPAQRQDPSGIPEEDQQQRPANNPDDQ